ncbi:MAG: glycosyltransferase family 2 protein [Solirubrobacteraceae bacterium]
MSRPTLRAIEGGGPHQAISIVLPTYNRAAALRENLGGFLAVEGIKEIVVVDDGSVDDTTAVLATHDDPRLHVVALERSGGQPRARNTGVDAASGSWVLFAEDDCRFPPDYARVLLGEAERHGAEIVGAPFIYPRDETDLPVAMARGRARPVRRVGMDSVKRFPAEPTRTPFMPATALVRRTVFDSVRFDERYGGNAWREETAFFVEAARRGFTCLLTNATAAYQLAHYEGGARVPRLSYEYWTLRNNWRFLQRHGDWLAEQGYLRSPSLAQLELLALRLRSLATGWVSTHLRGVAA